MKKLFIATIMLATTISPLAATDAHFEVALSHGGLRLLKGNPPQARKLAWGCADTATVITDKAAYSEIPPLYKPTHQEAEHLLIESDQIGKAAFFNLVLVEGKLALRHYNWHRQQMVFYVLSKTGIGQRYSVKLDDMIAAIAHSSPAPTERLIKAADYQRVNRILRNLREEMDSYSKGTFLRTMTSYTPPNEMGYSQPPITSRAFYSKKAGQSFLFGEKKLLAGGQKRSI